MWGSRAGPAAWQRGPATVPGRSPFRWLAVPPRSAKLGLCRVLPLPLRAPCCPGSPLPRLLHSTAERHTHATSVCFADKRGLGAGAAAAAGDWASAGAAEDGPAPEQEQPADPTSAEVLLAPHRPLSEQVGICVKQWKEKAMAKHRKQQQAQAAALAAKGGKGKPLSKTAVRPPPPPHERTPHPYHHQHHQQQYHHRPPDLQGYI